jgi:hypothetical protein
MSTPTDGLPGPACPADRLAVQHPLVRAWLRPVIPLLPVLLDTEDKPVGQFTMRELITWGTVLAYIAGSVALAEALALNVLRVAVRGR